MPVLLRADRRLQIQKQRARYILKVLPSKQPLRRADRPERALHTRQSLRHCFWRPGVPRSRAAQRPRSAGRVLPRVIRPWQPQRNNLPQIEENSRSQSHLRSRDQQIYIHQTRVRPRHRPALRRRRPRILLTPKQRSSYQIPAICAQHLRETWK